MGVGSGRAGRAGQQVEAGEAAIDHWPATSGVAAAAAADVVVVVVGVGAAIVVVGVVVVVAVVVVVGGVGVGVGVGCGGAAATVAVVAAAAEDGGMFEVSCSDPVGKLQDSGGCDVRLWLRPRTDERRMGCKRYRR